MSTLKSKTIQIVTDTLKKIERVDDLVESVLDYLSQNELTDLQSDRKDELSTKLYIALTILYSMDSKLCTICPEQTYTKTWIRNVLTILNLLEQENVMELAVV